ncbi:MAG TPA: DUF134 domain-containing protein [Candidatus Sulfomarinibacteraceae bacterium]|nr:DUF134 domain-containing protein [Candidatus Sulfomarinibacteraceae bacterium]
MPRTRNPRRVGGAPAFDAFKPIGRPARDLEVVTLGRDELEALRLADLEGLYQATAAERMGVSRATFGRILTGARAAVADALVGGKVLVIGEAPVAPGSGEPFPCPVHDGGRRRGLGCSCDEDEEPEARRGPTHAPAEEAQPKHEGSASPRAREESA